MPRTSPSMSRKTSPEGLYHVSPPLPHRQLRRPPPVARHRRLDRSSPVAIFMLNSSHGRSATTRRFSLPGSESQRAADAIQDRFPQETLYSSNVIFHSEDGLTDPGHEGRGRAGRRRSSPTAPHVDRREQPLRPARTDRQRRRTDRVRHGRLRHREGRASPSSTPPRRPSRTLRDAGIQVEYDGGLGYANVPAGGNSEMIGILMAVVILAIAFGSLVAMSLPIVTALIAIVVGSSAHRHHVRPRRRSRRSPASSR